MVLQEVGKMIEA